MHINRSMKVSDFMSIIKHWCSITEVTVAILETFKSGHTLDLLNRS